MIIDQISQELLKKYLEYEDAVGRLAVLYNLPNDVVREKLQSYVKARPITWRQAVELAMIEGSDIQKELANAQRQRSQR